MWSAAVLLPAFPHRVITEGLLERRRRLLLLAVTDHHRGAETDHQSRQLAPGCVRGRRPARSARCAHTTSRAAARANAIARNGGVSSRSSSRRHVESDATAPNNAA